MWNWKQNDERDRSGPVPVLWGSPVGKRNLWWEGFVQKLGFEPRVKEWRSDGWREWGWWQRWVNKWMKRWIKTRMVRLTIWIWQLIPKTKWCISKWAICDFQGDGWRARKSDNRWAGTARKLTRDKVVKIARLSSCKNFVSNREKFIFNAFVDLFSQWRDLRMGVIWVAHCSLPGNCCLCIAWFVRFSILIAVTCDLITVVRVVCVP